jgi:aldose 1-epimerase
VTRERFGTLSDGTAVDRFALTNKRGTEVRVITYGATLTACRTTDRGGTVRDIVLGFDRLEDYVERSPYFGATIGRYANRIGGARFPLDGRDYALPANDGPNHLHGGWRGFDKRNWSAEPLPDGRGVSLTRVSADGEEGYPGNLRTTVRYLLTDSNELEIQYLAISDAPTPVNLTHHSYFNLAGEGSGTVLDHHLWIGAASFTPVSDTLIPDGRLAPVAGTPFDFRSPTRIGLRIHDDDPQLDRARGYDHNFVLDRFDGTVRPIAAVWEPTSGRTLEVSSTEPGLQCYAGNLLDGSLRGKSGRVYGRFAGLCLEPQHFPDSPNRPAFPSTVLRPGGRYESTTRFRFGVADSAHAPEAGFR